MSIIAWIILGLVAGFIASKIVNRKGEGIILDILLGIFMKIWQKKKPHFSEVFLVSSKIHN